MTCDRCGVDVDTNLEDGAQEVSGWSRAEMLYCRDGEDTPEEDARLRNEFDFCAACTTTFLTWATQKGPH